MCDCDKKKKGGKKSAMPKSNPKPASKAPKKGK